MFPAVLAEKLHDLRKPLRTVRHAVLAQVFHKLHFRSVVKDSVSIPSRSVGSAVKACTCRFSLAFVPSPASYESPRLQTSRPALPPSIKKAFPRQIAGILTNRAISEQGKSLRALRSIVRSLRLAARICGLSVSPNYKIPANFLHPLHFHVSRSNDKATVLYLDSNLHQCYHSI